jgi:hypothetical protein
MTIGKREPVLNIQFQHFMISVLKKAFRKPIIPHQTTNPTEMASLKAADLFSVKGMVFVITGGGSGKRHLLLITRQDS